MMTNTKMGQTTVNVWGFDGNAGRLLYTGCVATMGKRCTTWSDVRALIAPYVGTDRVRVDMTYTKNGTTRTRRVWLAATPVASVREMQRAA